MSCSLSSAVAPRNVTSARSFEELMDTVIPVFSAGSRITFETSTPPLSRISKQKLPQRSVPIRLRKETALPSRAKPIAQIAEALPSTIAKSPAKLLFPGVGNAPHPCRIMSGLSSPATRILGIRRRAGNSICRLYLRSANATETMTVAVTKGDRRRSYARR